MGQPLITVIGSLNKDLVIRTSRVPEAGETITSESFATGSGGKGANQAVACARLSKKDVQADGIVAVRMVGAVGDDSFGHDLINGLRQDGINTDGVQLIGNIATGVSTIIVDENTGENRILFSPGANYSLSSEHMQQELLAHRPRLLVLQLEIARSRVLEALRLAKEHGIDVLLNPAPALELPEEVYPAITHLVMNETEASMLSGISGSDWGRVTRKFHDLGVEDVIITLGGDGVFYATGGQTGQISAETVKVVDTTAAGDTFVGAYASWVVSHTASGGYKELEVAVRRANQAAALTVQKHGAQDAIPFLGELRE